MDAEIIQGALGFGSVGILTLLIVEIGKRKAPGTFTSDMNVWWSVAIAIALNALYAYKVGGDVWASIPDGAVVGFTISGVSRGISAASTRTSIDMSDQVVPLGVGPVHEHDEEDDKGDGSTVVKGFGK